MNEETAIVLFCLIDDFLKTCPPKRLRDPKQQMMRESENVFAIILSAYEFKGDFRNGLSKLTHKLRYIVLPVQTSVRF
jgi:hypothetical protein